MVKSEILKLAEEFLSIEDESKFISDYVFLSDGRVASRFFRSYRRVIEPSENEICKKIMKQYNGFVKKVRNDPSQGMPFSGISMGIIGAFEAIDDLNKFDYNSEIVLPNGEKAGVFFARSKEYIKTRKTIYTDSIFAQYKKYLESKKNDEIRKYTMYKNKFYRVSEYDKFDINSDLEFSDGTSMYRWFNTNRSLIRKKASADLSSIEAKIMNQYETYIGLMYLKEEFYEERHLDKFSEYGNVKFNSGASMNMWWETNKDSVLESTKTIDIMIRRQYEKYLSLNNEPVCLTKKGV